jgi:hypothetical protein
MKAKKNVPQKGKFPNPPPKESTGSVESRKRTLSKDELIDFLERSFKECVKSIGCVIHETIPILLFMENALDQDNEMDDMVVHTRKYGDLNWCHSGNAAGTILGSLSTKLAECWDQIDRSEMEVDGKIESYRPDRPKAANSR